MGKRLRERLGDLPKPMIPIGGRPLLEHQIELSKRHGFTNIKVFACYRANVIKEYFGNGSRWGASISYVVEDEPLGTAGAVLAALDQLADRFLVLYGDVMANVDLGRIREAHNEAKADVTLLVHPNNHPFDSDLVEVDSNGWITEFHNRPHSPDTWYQNLVSAGLYVVERKALRNSPRSAGVFDFGKDLFPAMLKQGARLLGYNSLEYIKDIGTPERYEKICAEFQVGIVERSSLDTPQPAVFLDRDGTLIREVGGLTSPEQLELLHGAAAAVHELNHRGIRAVMVSNQPVVAKGFCTEADVEAGHRKLQTLLGREHAFLDRLYYCPHHPEKGFEGERPDLKIDCECRKPKPGMIIQAAREMNLDLKNSWLIGDTTVDVETARNAGVKSVLVRTGHAGRDQKFTTEPTLTGENVLDAVQQILARTAA